MQTKQDLTVRLLAMMILLAGLQPAGALTTILSTVPANGANSVLPGAPVVFTFSAAMNPTSTAALFHDETADYRIATRESGLECGQHGADLHPLAGLCQ